jgi:ATP-dependent RNA helicase RhlE
VSQISHIINYDIPEDTQVCVHRIGRTARMGKRGTAITLVTRDEGKLLTSVEMLINKEVPARTVEGYEPPPPVPFSPAAAARAKEPQPVVPLPAPKSIGAKHRPLRSRRFR